MHFAIQARLSVWLYTQPQQEQQSWDKKHQQNSKEEEDDRGRPAETRSLQHLTSHQSQASFS